MQKYKFVDRIKLYHGDSETKMNDVLSAIEKYTSCFFWLDAHLPADPGSQMKKEYTCSSDKIEFPLEVELRSIRESRDTKNDIILIDDLRIYLDGPFQYPGHIETMFEDSHNFHKIYNHEGYLLLLPKNRDK